MLRLVCLTSLTLGVLGGSATMGANLGPVAPSNVAGKKLLRVAQGLVWHTPAVDLAARVPAWQDAGYDGVCLSLTIDPAVTPPAEGRDGNMAFRWWDVDARSPEEFSRDLQAFAQVGDWGRLTDNLLWMASHSEGHRPPDWFSDADWEVVLGNARLGAAIARDAGFKGILFDAEGYGGGAYGVWRQPWDYPLYAGTDYRISGETQPRPFAEVAAQVRLRGRQWAQTLTDVYPELVLFVIPGLYEVTWTRSLWLEKPPEDTDCGLWAPFVDGILEGLGPRATLVSGTEATYLQSQYRDMLVHRDQCLRQALSLSALPELARQRITFSVGIWTDAGYGAFGRFSPTDVRQNHRDPERHKHAVHNALAASDQYAWQWGEWGEAGEYALLTDSPTPLMLDYWKANREGHEPQDLGWEPAPLTDTTDYTATEAEALEREEAFWPAQAREGYAVAMELPEVWKFRFDPEMLVRYSPWARPSFDDSSWMPIRTTACWQSQGVYANGPGVYRLSFEVPGTLDPAKQQVLLAFGGLGSGQGHVYLNGEWVEWLLPLVDVAAKIKPGQGNTLAIVCLNRQGPGGLMGRVKLLVRPVQ